MQEQVQDQTTVTADEQPQVEQSTPAVESQEQAAPPQDDAAAFEAGFNQAQGIQAPEPEPAPPPEPALIAGMTEEQIKEAVAKAAEVDKLKEQQAKLFGTIGNFKQTLDQLKSAPKPTAAQVQLTKEKFARLSKDFPEMAELIAADLNEALQGAAVGADASQFEGVVQQRVSSAVDQVKTEIQQQYEAKLLAIQHKDWRQVVTSNEFAQWTQTLPEDVRNELGSTWDSTFLGDKLTEFKAWKQQSATSAQTKQKRLEAAITPKGTPTTGSNQSEYDAFVSGFKSARGIT
jgi:hypothetical protein